MQNPLLPCIHRTHSSVLSFNRTFFFCSFSNQSVLLCDSCFPKCPSLKKKKRLPTSSFLHHKDAIHYFLPSAWNTVKETPTNQSIRTILFIQWWSENDDQKFAPWSGFLFLFFYELCCALVKLFVSNTCLTCPQCLPVCKKEDKLSQMSTAILSQNLLSSDGVVELQSSGLTHIPIHPNVRKVNLSKQTLELTPVSLELPRITFLGKIMCNMKFTLAYVLPDIMGGWSSWPAPQPNIRRPSRCFGLTYVELSYHLSSYPSSVFLKQHLWWAFWGLVHTQVLL